MKIAKGMLTALLVTAASPAMAQATGSGTVKFEFLNFYGPFALAQDPNDPSTWFNNSQFNGQFSGDHYTNGDPVFDYLSTKDANDSGGTVYGVGGRAFTRDNSGATIVGPSSVTFSEAAAGFDFGNPNVLSFASSGFIDVAKGTPFTLGTLSFTNGSWWGSGGTPADNTASLFGFRVSTVSPNGPTFNQTSYGIIRMVVNSPSNNDTTTQAGMDAEADWVSVYSYNDSATYGRAYNCFISSSCNGLPGLGSFRVYDGFALPAGYTNTGTIEITAMFNSLDLISLDNPNGGFLTAGNGALPPVPPRVPSVPEPATWLTMLLGFGTLGGALRRRAKMARATG